MSIDSKNYTGVSRTDIRKFVTKVSYRDFESSTPFQDFRGVWLTRRACEFPPEDPENPPKPEPKMDAKSLFIGNFDVIGAITKNKNIDDLGGLLDQSDIGPDGALDFINGFNHDSKIPCLAVQNTVDHGYLLVVTAEGEPIVAMKVFV